MTGSASRLPPIDPELLRLVEAERRRPPPSRGELDRVLARLGASLATPGSDPGAALGGSGAASGGALSTTLKLLVLAVIVGGLFAALSYQAGIWTRGPAAAPAAGPSVLPRRELRLHRGASEGGEQAQLPAPEPPVTPAPGSSSSAGTRDAGGSPRPRATETADPLGAERRLLDRARSVLARGQSERALESLALHRRRYPAGHLVEEREALRVFALVRAGQQQAARAAAAAFARRYPRSILLPVVKDAINKSP